MEFLNQLKLKHKTVVTPLCKTIQQYLNMMIFFFFFIYVQTAHQVKISLLKSHSIILVDLKSFHSIVQKLHHSNSIHVRKQPQTFLESIKKAN